MYTRLKGIYLKNKALKSVDLFGYANQGLPGIEVVGLGGFGKQVKEKFVYLSKMNNLNIPFRRYVLCVEATERQLTSLEKRWLELPLLILFLSLSGKVPIKRLEDCFCSGIVSPTGSIYPLKMELDALQKVVEVCPGLKLITTQFLEGPRNLDIFPLEFLLEEITSLKVKAPIFK